jgi:hypothetical protein
MCNIPIYFCNIQMKHMQHLDETSKTLETYVCNMRFQRNVTLVVGRMKKLVVVELVGTKVRGGACNSAVHQRSGEHCATLGEHLLGGVGGTRRRLTRASY